MRNFLKHVLGYFKRDTFTPISIHKVFVSSGIPEFTRIELPEQNQIFSNFFESTNEHLIIHGPSKSGKSTLWGSRLFDENVIKIPCRPKTTLTDLYCEIVDELNIYFLSAKDTGVDIKEEFKSEVYAKLAEFGRSSSVTSSVSRSEKTHEERLVHPIISSRNLNKYIKAAKKFVVIENIHYADDDLKHELAKELHNFSDYKCKWILVGVQHKADDIFLENRDLVGRLREIPTGYFSKDQIFEILEKGEAVLNIKLSVELKDKIFQESQGVSALAQDIAKNYCILAGIDKTQRASRRLDLDVELFKRCCGLIGNSNVQVFRRFVSDIQKGGRSDGTTKKYYWILRVIKDNMIPKDGIYNTDIFRHIQEYAQSTSDQSGITQGLQYINKMQDNNNISPPVLEYDESRKKLFILDPYFKFVLSWTDLLS
jgi:hypothetical protein